ncbi:ASCH domain-containing protein [Yersinia massiliensis]|uniref:hypothetical protein n=1 Tax=Yersinia massiliensis TaxID=419257 RepID=UPI0011A1B4DF|nr:hypothetical protein [Yersinia massiliensis]
MKERPILFNAEMVKAILSGRKTQTRRIISEKTLHLFDVAASAGECHPLEVRDERSKSYYSEFCPLGKPDDQLWVRETFGDCGVRLVYRSDSDDGAACMVKRWTPSIHMPRWASRINLLITGVRVERLRDISEQDASAEGVLANEYSAARHVFGALWQSIYGADNSKSWQGNPWVWVIQFEQIPFAPAPEASL